MASNKYLSFNWPDYVVNNRNAFIVSSLAVAGFGAAAVALHFLVGRSRNVAYSRTAEIACLLRFALQ